MEFFTRKRLDNSYVERARISPLHPLYIQYPSPNFHSNGRVLCHRTSICRVYKATYFSAPSLLILNVTKEHSLACGSPDPDPDPDPDLEDVMQAWTRFLDLNNLADPANVACLGSFPGAPGYAEWLMSFNFNFNVNVNANDRRWQSFGFSSSFTNRN
eukprot:scaffold5247_cov158-Skeletonema_marinoi.AAC.9